MEPDTFLQLFSNTDIEIPELIYKGQLTSDIINTIQENDWTEEDCKLPTVKEGVVFKRSTLLKGQRRPSVKVKTKWWLEKLHSLYTEEDVNAELKALQNKKERYFSLFFIIASISALVNTSLRPQKRQDTSSSSALPSFFCSSSIIGFLIYSNILFKYLLIGSLESI